MSHIFNNDSDMPCTEGERGERHDLVSENPPWSSAWYLKVLHVLTLNLSLPVYQVRLDWLH